MEIHNDFMKAVDAVHIKYCPDKVIMNKNLKSDVWKAFATAQDPKAFYFNMLALNVLDHKSS